MEPQLPKSVFFVMNPEGKVFNDSVRTEKHICKMCFVDSWFSSWGIKSTMIEADSIFRMFERVGFQIIEVQIPIKN